jgi:hypothetical protein
MAREHAGAVRHRAEVESGMARRRLKAGAQPNASPESESTTRLDVLLEHHGRQLLDAVRQVLRHRHVRQREAEARLARRRLEACLTLLPHTGRGVQRRVQQTQQRVDAGVRHGETPDSAHERADAREGPARFCWRMPFRSPARRPTHGRRDAHTKPRAVTSLCVLRVWRARRAGYARCAARRSAARGSAKAGCAARRCGEFAGSKNARMASLKALPAPTPAAKARARRAAPQHRADRKPLADAPARRHHGTPGARPSWRRCLPRPAPSWRPARRPCRCGGARWTRGRC